MSLLTNCVILDGYCGADVELRKTSNDKSVAQATLYTHEYWTDANSKEKQERSERHRLVFFNKSADLAAQLIKKGTQLKIMGKLRTRNWIDKDKIERWTTEIVVDQFRVAGSKPEIDNAETPLNCEEEIVSV